MKKRKDKRKEILRAMRSVCTYNENHSVYTAIGDHFNMNKDIINLQNIFAQDLVTQDVFTIITTIEDEYNNAPVKIQHCMNSHHTGYFYAIASMDGSKITYVPCVYRRTSITWTADFLSLLDAVYHQEILTFYLRMVRYIIKETNKIDMDIRTAHIGTIVRNTVWTDDELRKQYNEVCSLTIPDNMLDFYIDYKKDHKQDIDEFNSIVIPSVTNKQKEKFMLRLDEDEYYYNAIYVNDMTIIPTKSYLGTKPLVYVIKNNKLKDEIRYSNVDYDAPEEEWGENP